ncbi:MAG TPA: SRPBCC domain-containing protein, partial [Dongiaceae bacterium]
MEQLETINSETVIEADPATIFAYLTDADRLTRWLGASATVDPRPGGIYLVEVGHGNVSRGEFKEVVPVSRLAYSWGWEKGPNLPPGGSLIEIDLIPRNGT